MFTMEIEYGHEAPKIYINIYIYVSDYLFIYQSIHHLYIKVCIYMSIYPYIYLAISLEWFSVLTHTFGWYLKYCISISETISFYIYLSNIYS